MTTSAPKTNRIGLTLADYKGSPSTLCDGCGHDAITSQIIKSFFELGLSPHQVAKLSGIGCSSKTPAYFLNQAHGFNAVHGRMPSIATGVSMANHNLTMIAVSGDGDTASIGLGQFCHLVRRNVPMIYIVENNGVYGLTKGQFSATADLGSKLKTGVLNELPPIDLCGLAIELGCGFVGRSFAGDPKQLTALIKAAASHKGTAVLDVISPCVTFNNHEGSTKSYKYAKEMETPLHELGYIPFFEQINVEYEPGSVQEVELHNGSKITLKKTEHDYDPTCAINAMKTIKQAHIDKQFLTGLLYIDEQKPDFTSLLRVGEAPLATLPEEKTRPSKDVLKEIMEALM
ncbi:MAG TPA: 2-oxoacid:ferredoxin oxidoreductase subunit beta [Candidatus Obscuribacter sp.]|nr:2-oxoacid:ferredoxin oxidoreductase subunit beta [Candidatus Obscuribacter sp.]MBL8081612.1 2-oxoacid:ferredoxin oxidoreductase subunit beta [Candidatus Obscuribacter sp.]HMY52290.1 2-oxoacid:ferredoxin oxidoreductase subunit beta [Candidatus Obscuribacter sp.]HNB14197.1 2-oxoacid:ferredoxin oxidoreductase subunit beta [Candidatus Obscuribacter sp.]HND65473.1 2-oxoacid:ferredoxin oxidoreductase subunit beta [Candidatus Obscuribacter sp.]